MSSHHSRNQSAATTDTASSYHLMMDHVLQYPGSHEIPLRTMYTLNCAPRAQPLPVSRDLSRAPSPTANSSNPSPISPHPAWNEAESATMNFTAQLMSHIGSLPDKHTSLPPTFIVSFVSRCFQPCLAMVNFPQALTAMDYLRDLEKRRCQEYVAALKRLGISIETFDADVQAVSDRYPGIALWAKNMHGKNKKAESCYAVMYLGLRRWVLINELSLLPFNKLNCMGMLNTLLPPQSPSGKSKLPTPLLTHQTLKEERARFFEYIRLVEKNGPSVLRPALEMNRGPGEENGWGVVQRTVEKYLRVAKSMIDECSHITGRDDFTYVNEPKEKKTDSGVSFGPVQQRPTTASNVMDKPLPLSPADLKAAPKGPSTLERITGGFKRMRVKTRVDVEEIVKVDKQKAVATLPAPTDATSKGPKSLKKARSFANLTHLRGGNGSSLSLASRKGGDAVPFDVKQMKRQRMAYEASAANSEISKNQL